MALVRADGTIKEETEPIERIKEKYSKILILPLLMRKRLRKWRNEGGKE
jgi:hypothetical protein